MNHDALRGFLAEAIRMCVHRWGVKSIDLYRAYLWNIVGKYIADINMGKVTGFPAEDILDAIARFIPEAWYSGMEANGLAQDEMEDEWQEILDGIVQSESAQLNSLYSYLHGLVDTDPANAMEPAHARIELWVNRYNDVRNQAIRITSSAKNKLEWVYGDTEHCDTCAALNGIVASASIWEQSGVRPQEPPNKLLSCGGWRCQCRLDPTRKRQTRDAWGRIREIAGLPK